MAETENGDQGTTGTSAETGPSRVAGTLNSAMPCFRSPNRSVDDRQNRIVSAAPTTGVVINRTAGMSCMLHRVEGDTHQVTPDCKQVRTQRSDGVELQVVAFQNAAIYERNRRDSAEPDHGIHKTEDG